MFCDFDISMLVMGMAVDDNTLDTVGLGGSESAALYMAKALGRLGARVSLFCNTPRQSTDRVGVHYYPASAWPTFAKETPHDICIVQRAPEAFAQQTNARLNLLWCHDLALGREERRLRASLWNIDRLIVLSPYMRQQYQAVFGLSDDIFFVSRNGIDLELFQSLERESISRDRRKLFYAARPERGLDVLLRDILPLLLKQEPELRLFTATYDNCTAEWRDFYTDCDYLARGFGDRVVRLGSLSKPQLYRHYLSAGVYVYPTPSPTLPRFREVSCISAMECQAAGLPIVTTAIGALPDTIAPDAGILIKADTCGESLSPLYISHFVDGVLAFIRDNDRWAIANDSGLRRARDLDWSAVACDWLIEFERLIRARNDSSDRLACHFRRHGDPAGARTTNGSGLWSQDLSFDETTIERPQSPGGPADNRPNAYSCDVSTDGCYGAIQNWLQDHKSNARNILDVECAHGEYALALARHFPDLRLYGVDTNRLAIDAATAEAAKMGLAGRATFSVVLNQNSSSQLSLPGTWPTFDLVVLRRVLECSWQPWAVLEQLERQVIQGGEVFIIVPYGPPRFRVSDNAPGSKQLWNLDAHDLRDMVGSKPNFALSSCFDADDPTTREPQGWWIIHYTADHEPIPPIDDTRRSWLQRPRQTVSAAIIGGPGAEETLHWTLRSIQEVVDEIILADCGMNDEALRIAAQYDVQLIRGVDPLVEGFERARNISLEACRSDWCLWIDTDERLVGAPMLPKFLRDNAYHGYSIRQHNFACDTVSTPDVPVRLFRRRSYDGRTVRFWGAIHEHPELALNVGAGPSLCLPDVHIAHVGYLSEEGRRDRFTRNTPLLDLDQQRYPERLIQKFFIIRDKMNSVRHLLVSNGGRVTDEICTTCRQIVEMFRLYFLGKSHPVAGSSLEFYSDALTVLGEGFEAAFQVDADKTEVKPNGCRRYRFASTDDFTAELKRAVAEKARRFDSQDW